MQILITTVFHDHAIFIISLCTQIKKYINISLHSFLNYFKSYLYNILIIITVSVNMLFRKNFYFDKSIFHNLSNIRNILQGMLL